MGEVHRARDPRLGRDVAIKVLPARYSRDPDRLRRFEQEARAASALNHPAILTIHDFGQHDGALYVVAELQASSFQLQARIPHPAPRTPRDTYCRGSIAVRRRWGTMASLHVEREKRVERG
jgi:serine/threonine protein kinase